MLNPNSLYDTQAKLHIKTNKDNTFLTNTLLDGKIALFEALLRNGVRRGVNECFVVVIHKNLSQYYRSLLELGANPNQLSLNSLKHSLLVDATQKQHMELSQLLIDFGASTAVYTHNRGTIEQGPCLDGLTIPSDSFEAIYQRQAEVLIEEGEAENALSVAAFINATAFAKVLFKNNVKVNVPSRFICPDNQQRLTAFEIFCMNHNHTAIQYCIDGNANPNELNGQHFPLALAVIFKKHGTVEFLIKNGALSGINEGLFLAIKNNDLNMVNILLKNGADPNRKGILVAATQSKNSKIVEVLLAHGADVEAKKALMLSIKDNEISVAATLFDHVNKKIDFPPELLLDAISDGTKHVMAILLLNNGANVNGTTQNGVTPLMRAVKNNDIPAVNLLLAFHPNMNLRAKNTPVGEDNDILGMTAIEIAERQGNPEMIKLLLNNGAQPMAHPVQHTLLPHYEQPRAAQTTPRERRGCVIS